MAFVRVFSVLAHHPRPVKKTLLSLALAAASLAAHGAPMPIDTSPVAAQRKALPLPAHWHRGAFMEVFVRAYQDSNGDGIGDLRGLISRLDYLQDLGVKGLWLMPIQANADGDHGYATTDHRAVAPEYGTLQDLDELIREAGQRGIGIIIDQVLNHSAAAHPMFEHARSNPNSPWRDWFVWQDQAPQGWEIWDKNPWYWVGGEPWNFSGKAKDLPAPPAGARNFYFGAFGPHMPDYNWRNPAVIAYHRDSLRFWLNRGLAGFRLDAVPHLVENNAADWNDQPQSRALTHAVVQDIKRYPGRYVVCEATAKPQDWGDDKVCGGAFAFGYVHHFGKAAMGDAASVKELAAYFTQASFNMATFVSNHDRFAGLRLWDQVNGNEARYRLAAAAYLLQPGTPYIYYGEEIGQAGVNTLRGDLSLRSPMSWTHDPGTAGFTTGSPFRPLAPNSVSHNAQAQIGDPQSLHTFYKAMLALRNSRASIARGSFEHSMADGLLLGFERKLGRERSLVVINFGTEPAALDMDRWPAKTLRLLHGEVDKENGGKVPPLSIQVWDLR
jgi:alpha-amylase